MYHKEDNIVQILRTGRPARKIQIGYTTPDPWYEKAFYGEEPEEESEFTRNTTTWD